MAAITSSFIAVDGINVFYRSAGPDDAPVVLALHGFPTSSIQYSKLLSGLGDEYHVIAPDLPGYGFTEISAERKFVYSFDALSKTVEAFVDALGIDKLSLYLFDFGAPCGIRLALRRPELIQAVISQSGNLFEEGLGPFWDPIRELWARPTEANFKHLQETLLTFETTKYQYTHGELADVVAHLDPAAWTLDFALLSRPGNFAIQLALFEDYKTNLPTYKPVQQLLADRAVPVLACWGANDPIFIAAGAKAFERLPMAKVVLLDGGHFALEGHAAEIVALCKEFLAGVHGKQQQQQQQ